MVPLVEMSDMHCSSGPESLCANLTRLEGARR